MRKYVPKEQCIMEENKKRLGQRVKKKKKNRLENGLVLSLTINLAEYALGK